MALPGLNNLKSGPGIKGFLTGVQTVTKSDDTWLMVCVRNNIDLGATCSDFGHVFIYALLMNVMDLNGIVIEI